MVLPGYLAGRAACLLDVPYAILINIGLYLDFVSVIRLHRVCKATFFAVNSEIFWTQYIGKDLELLKHPKYSTYLFDSGAAEGSDSKITILKKAVFRIRRCLRINSHLPPPGSIQDRGWAAELPVHFLQNAAAKTGSLTLALWVRVPESSFGGIILGYQSKPYQWSDHAHFHQQPLIFSRDFVYGGLGGVGATAAFQLCDGAWHHVAFVATPTCHTLYVDGNILGKSEGSYQNEEHSKCVYAQLGTGIVTGRINPVGKCYWRPFDGDLRDFRVWAAPLSTEDIRAAMASPFVRLEALLCDFPFYGSARNVYGRRGDADERVRDEVAGYVRAWPKVSLPALTASGPEDTNAIVLKCFAPMFVDRSTLAQLDMPAVRISEAVASAAKGEQQNKKLRKKREANYQKASLGIVKPSRRDRTTPPRSRSR